MRSIEVHKYMYFMYFIIQEILFSVIVHRVLEHIGLRQTLWIRNSAAAGATKNPSLDRNHAWHCPVSGQATLEY